VFSKMKKKRVQHSVPNSEVTYPISESYLDKNCTYIPGSHHDVYLVQFSNYRSVRVIILTNQRDGNFGNLATRKSRLVIT
jgi:hypothetical protein